MPDPKFASEIDKIVARILEGELGPEDIKAIEVQIKSLKKFDFRPLINRIFDMNEDFNLNKSEANKGILGWLNKRGRKRKNRVFKRKIFNKKKTPKVIIAEGDSWFEHPLLKDILDWVIKIYDCPIYSLADGGDWIGNILYTGDYIHELSLYLPDAFLISGGGNDLVGNNRLALMVKKMNQVDVNFDGNDTLLKNTYINDGISKEIAHRIVLGRKFLNKDFWALINVFRFQYALIFHNIETSGKFPNMKIITQGYDYPIPSSNRSHIIRKFMRNGKWLDKPLNIRGIYDNVHKTAIMTTMIHEFNEMLIDIGKDRKNVYHIDSRGYAKPSYWFDELHLKSKYNKRIAETYIDCIESSDPTKKVFRVNKDAVGVPSTNSTVPSQT